MTIARITWSYRRVPLLRTTVASPSFSADISTAGDFQVDNQHVLNLFSFSATVQTSSPSGNQLWTPMGKDIFFTEQTLIHISVLFTVYGSGFSRKKRARCIKPTMQQLRVMEKNIALAYMGFLAEIGCRTLRYREVSTMFCHKDTNIIASLQIQEAPWRVIQDNSIVHDVYRTVCSDFPVDTGHGGTVLTED